ncbi:MAG: hypothetical protein M1820_009167 [Bogoriella megaspora]|nr:MAG: hypothetical protein M1820_009167 [Bogoriella megaspora]
MEGLNFEALGKLYEEGQYADLIICCEGHEFRAHRAIVCLKWPLIKAACEKEPRIFTTPKDGDLSAQIVKLDEITVVAMTAMLHWIYHGSCHDTVERLGELYYVDVQLYCMARACPCAKALIPDIMTSLTLRGRATYHYYNLDGVDLTSAVSFAWKNAPLEQQSDADLRNLLLELVALSRSAADNSWNDELSMKYRKSIKSLFKNQSFVLDFVRYNDGHRVEIIQ